MPITRRLVLLVLTVASLAALPTAAEARTVWLCRPGAADNPCEPSLRTTVLSPSGFRLGIENVTAAENPKLDCFYVYPTVSNQPTPAATQTVEPELRSIALYQAARFSRECRVWAPVYRQITVSGLLSGSTTAGAIETAYGDVRSAWRRYLSKYNKGRGVVLISHSQGTAMLRRLVAEEIDGNDSVRDRLVSAILLGGDVKVKAGEDAGGDFENVPACRSKRQFGCVVAFSTYGAPPVASLFGRAPSGFDALFRLPVKEDGEVLCTNPTDLGGSSGRATSVVPTEPFAPGAIGAATQAVGLKVPEVSTPWVQYRRAFKARCSSEAGANVLQVRPLAGAPDLVPLPTPQWGLHLVDANIALANLTDLVRSQAAAYANERTPAASGSTDRPSFTG